MSTKIQSFFERFLDYPLPVIFAGFYMYWMSRVLNWAMTVPNPSETEWLVASVVAGGAAYFKFYTDLIVRSSKEV